MFTNRDCFKSLVHYGSFLLKISSYAQSVIQSPISFFFFAPLAPSRSLPSFFEVVRISSDTLGVILSGAFPHEDLIFWLFPFPNSPVPLFLKFQNQELNTRTPKIYNSKESS